MEQDSVSQENLEAEICNICNIFQNNVEPNWALVTHWVKVQFQINRSEGVNLKCSEDYVYRLLFIIRAIDKKFSWYNSLEAPIQECLTETLKALRTYVTNEEVARYLINERVFYLFIGKLMGCIFTKKNGEELFTKYLLQLFLNLLSVGSDEQRKVTKERLRGFGEKFKLYFLGSYGYIYETSAVLYNLFSDTDLEDEDLINYIILYHDHIHKTNEYLDFLMEKLISTDYLWHIYKDFNVRTRLALLRCVKEVLICQNSENLVIRVNTLPLACLERFVTVFKKSANVVFQVTDADCTKATQEVAYILELLSHASSDEKSLQFLQNHEDLFINAGVLLLNMHRLGQMSNNVFTPIQKLAENGKQGGETRNPVFGFKADLVRLIGNLCWRNKKMQDLAREAEVIPVLLDCCNIDQKNPFIIQWVILAIRNVCENNRENQAIIAGLTQQGVIDPAVLQQCGLTLHAEEDLRIGIVNLNLNK